MKKMLFLFFLLHVPCVAMQKAESPATMMILAILRDRSDQADQLIQKGINVCWRDILGDTFLHHAAACARLVIAQQLLDAGADINAISFDGRTPFLQAIRFHHPEFAHWLIDQGADVTKGDIHGKNALRYVKTSEFKEIRALADRIEYLTKNKK